MKKKVNHFLITDWKTFYPKRTQFPLHIYISALPTVAKMNSIVVLLYCFQSHFVTPRGVLKEDTVVDSPHRAAMSPVFQLTSKPLGGASWNYFGKRGLTSLFHNCFIWIFDGSVHVEHWCHSSGMFFFFLSWLRSAASRSPVTSSHCTLPKDACIFQSCKTSWELLRCNWVACMLEEVYECDVSFRERCTKFDCSSKLWA